VARAVVAFGNADASWLAIRNESEGKLESAASHNLSSESCRRLGLDIESWLPSLVTVENRPAVFTDLTSHSVLAEVAARDSLAVGGIIPIVYNEKLTGVIGVFWNEYKRPISHYIEPVLLLANQIAPAIENAKLLMEARRRAEALQAIFNVTQMIGAVPSVKFALNVIMDEVNRLLGTSQSTIRLIDPVTQELVIHASRGFSKSTLRRIRLRVGQGVMGWVAKHGKPLVLNDARADPRFSYYPQDAEQVCSLISVPLTVQGKTIGVLTISSPKPRVFTKEDENLVTTLAGQAAIAIENSRLYEQARRRLSQQKLLYRIAQHLASTVDVPSALRFVVNNLCTFFRAKFGAVRLLDQTGERLEIAAVYAATDEYIRMAHEEDQMSLDPSLPGGKSPAAFAIKDQKIYAISNVFKDRRFALLREWARRQGFTSVVCVPLIATDAPIGVLSLYFREPRRLQPDEYELLQTAGRTTAIAVQRTMLDERLLKEEVTRRALEEVSHLKTEFVSLVSHELRTPLTSIQGYVKLMLAGHAGELTPLQDEFLNTVNRNTERLIALVNDLLDISKIESGRMDLVFEPLDIKEVIEREVQLLQNQAQEKEITVVVNVEEDIPKVRADNHRLGQIISNLLSNAIKYSPNNSVVKINAGRLGNSVLVKVIDSGIGIGPEERSKLFQRFYRGESDVVRRTWGTGLGLAITRYLTEMHGGKIWVESEKGQGSTFSFTIPAVQE
jgi:signal transduction histidine kinase